MIGLFQKMFCKHEWDLMDKTVMMSDVERLLSNERLIKTEGIPIGNETVVLTLACKKCGKLVIESHGQ